MYIQYGLRRDPPSFQVKEADRDGGHRERVSYLWIFSYRYEPQILIFQFSSAEQGSLNAQVCMGCDFVGASPSCDWIILGLTT